MLGGTTGRPGSFNLVCRTIASGSLGDLLCPARRWMHAQTKANSQRALVLYNGRLSHLVMPTHPPSITPSPNTTTLGMIEQCKSRLRPLCVSAERHLNPPLGDRLSAPNDSQPARPPASPTFCLCTQPSTEPVVKDPSLWSQCCSWVATCRAIDTADKAVHSLQSAPLSFASMQ